jgi:hypothetical protein
MIIGMVMLKNRRHEEAPSMAADSCSDGGTLCSAAKISRAMNGVAGEVDRRVDQADLQQQVVDDTALSVEQEPEHPRRHDGGDGPRDEHDRSHPPPSPERVVQHESDAQAEQGFDQR